ncbi:MAG TPA: hypothetical protein VM870_09625 [Pyrinomonadaceae bacterium]|jgi:hypothetical protein|nr:hypothetical protein [Pyrinomonadaceae bacterium]
MPVNEKQATTTPPKNRPGVTNATRATPPAAQKNTVAGRAANASPPESVADAVKSTLKDALFEKRPYLKYAFANPYNLALFLGALAASAITLNPFLAVAALGLEGLWVLHAPESKFLKRILWDPKFEKIRLALEQQALNERVAGLEGFERERAERLMASNQEIHRLAARNPSFTGELLRTELNKTGRLVNAFIDLAVTCSRYQEYLDSIDLMDLERDKRRWESVIKQAGEETPQIEIAKKNLAVIVKRLEKLQEIQNYLTVARGQLDLIENSFQLIADQIVTMQSPQELSGQLDELLDGVEAIRETAVDTEKLLRTL